MREGWKEVTLDKLCKIGRGSSPRPIADSKYFDGGTIPWLKIADATASGKRIYITKEFVNEYGASFSRLLPKGSLVFATSGVSLGQVKFLGVECCIHDGWIYFDDFKKELDKEFLYYNLEILTSYFHGQSYGAAIQNVNTGILKSTKINLPPLETQKKIASILSGYDDLIENNLKRIKILEEMAQQTYEEWFVRMRFPGHQSATINPETGLPEGWEKVKLKDCCDLVMGQSPKSEFYNDEKLGLPFHQGVKDYGFRFPINTSWSTAGNKKAKPNSILFSVRAPVGRLNVAAEEIILGRGLAAINHKNGLNSFIFYQLRKIFFEDNLIGGGAIFASVTKTDVERIEFIYNEELANKFNDFASKIDQQILNLTNQNQRLREARDILLPRLMMGMIEV